MQDHTDLLLDVLASQARTALDDPEALGFVDLADGPTESLAYALGRLDEIINVLNPADETGEAYAATLTILGRHLEERRSAIEENELSYEEHSDDSKEAYETAHEALGRALDALDEAINALTPEPAA